MVKGYLKMADAWSSDTTSDYCNECFSDISSEKSLEYVIVGQKPSATHRKSKRNFLQKLFTREVRKVNLYLTKTSISIYNISRYKAQCLSIPKF